MKQKGKLSVFEIIFCVFSSAFPVSVFEVYGWAGSLKRNRAPELSSCLSLFFFFFWNQRLRSGSQAIVTEKHAMKAMWQRANADLWGHCGFLSFSPTSQAIYQQVWGLYFQRISELDHFSLPTSLGRATILWPPSQALFHHVFPVPRAGLIPGSLAVRSRHSLLCAKSCRGSLGKNENQSLAKDLEDSVQGSSPRPSCLVPSPSPSLLCTSHPGLLLAVLENTVLSPPQGHGLWWNVLLPEIHGLHSLNSFKYWFVVDCCSVAQSCPTACDPLPGLQHARLPCPSPPSPDTCL